MKQIFTLIIIVILSNACVSKKKMDVLSQEKMSVEDEKKQLMAQLKQSQDQYQDIMKKYTDEQNMLKSQKEMSDSKMNEYLTKIKSLESQLELSNRTNTNLLSRLEDLSIISKSGAESMQKSLEAINQQSKYIQGLNSKIQMKDSLNLALLTNLKRSLADVNDSDVHVEVRGGLVYISIADKLLFKSGSYDINAAAEAVLGKVAKVVNDHKDIDILIEGHTDNVSISTDKIKDNWDLSVLRSTSVARLLQKKFGVEPDRMTAGGKSEYSPKESNDSASGKQANRRTEIVITPKLDQYIGLMAPQGSN
ncbi:MAG: OmpA family protein [Saprospiraceae bacterium]